MINERFFLGLPQSFNEKCYVYPPTILDSLNKSFSKYKRILTISQEELEDSFIQQKEQNNLPDIDFNVPTPFEFLLNNAYHSKEFENLAKQAFELFIHQPVTFLYEAKTMLLGDLEQKLIDGVKLDQLVFIKEEEYFDLQNLIRQACGDEAINPPDPNLDPRVKRMKAKARYRDKVKAERGLGISFGTSLAAICCMEVGLNPLTIGKISFVAFKALMDTYQKKERYQIDIDSLMAGADSKKVKPKYWISNNDEEKSKIKQ